MQRHQKKGSNKDCKGKGYSLSWVQLCDSMDCRTPGSSGHGILQARILE